MKKQNQSHRYKYEQITNLENNLYGKMLKSLNKRLQRVKHCKDTEDWDRQLSKCIDDYAKLMRMRYLQQKERHDSSTQSRNTEFIP